jgi:hypothetical protein
MCSTLVSAADTDGGMNLITQAVLTLRAREFCGRRSCKFMVLTVPAMHVQEGMERRVLSVDTAATC